MTDNSYRSQRLSRLGPFLLTAAVLVMFAPSAFAGTINLILSDFDAVYRGDTQLLKDNVAAIGGNLTPAESDELESTVIENDGVIVDVMSPDETTMYADLQLGGLPGLLDLAANTPLSINTTGFGLDWFTSNGFYLRLKIDAVDVLLTNGVFFFTTEAVVEDQALPLGLRIAQEVSVSFTATSPAVQAGTTTTMASASGALTISGLAVLVPEPVTASLCLLALVFGITLYRRSVQL